MPTVLWIGPYRFFFFASDRGEPLHVHVERENMVAKFWLAPVRLQYSKGFGRPELGKLKLMVDENRQRFEEAWYAYFGN
jgi:hypothetical protein